MGTAGVAGTVGVAGAAPLVIAHRGASGYRPEHTLAGYALAARLGADYLEPDLVSTADGELVARHEPEISATTDVAERPEFAARRRTRTIDGQQISGWFTQDFTLAELRRVRAVERIPDVRPQNTVYDRRFPIPTLQEIIDLARVLSAELGRQIGIYPETKHPGYFRSIGLPLEPALVDTLERNGLNRAAAPVHVQSFEVANLRALRYQLGVPLVQLIGADACGDALVSPAGLAGIAGYADAIGPAKQRIVAPGTAGPPGPPSTLVADAHAAGLAVHAYTFRAENRYLPTDLRRGADPAGYGDALAEHARFFALGVDAVFTDHPDIAVAARAASTIIDHRSWPALV